MTSWKPKATKLTSFIYGFILPMLIPIENYFHGSFSMFMVLIFCIVGAVFFVIGLGNFDTTPRLIFYKSKNYKPGTITRVGFVWLGMIAGIPLCMLIGYLLGK